MKNFKPSISGLKMQPRSWDPGPQFGRVFMSAAGKTAKSLTTKLATFNSSVFIRIPLRKPGQTWKGNAG